MRFRLASRRLRLVAAALLALALGSPAGAGDFLGAGRMYRFDQITVVYPVGEGEPVEANRLSAERRAAFLRDVHGVVAETAPDDDVTDEQKRGHLLLLGWSNRLLGAPGVPSPIVVDDEGQRRFLDVPVPAGHDLLFVHDSPYNLGEKWMVFWSRLDLELDRFQVLPLSGADWAIFRDYLAVREGKIRVEIVWPPRRDPEVDIRRGVVPPPARRSSDHYTLHYPGNPFDTATADALLAAREAALANAVARLGAPPPGFRVRVFLYENRDSKLENSGVPDPTHSIPRNRELHMLFDEAMGDGFREELHLLAYERFGASYVSSLYEGLATAHEAADEDADLPVIAALLLQRDAFPGVEALLDESAFRRMTRSGYGFAAAGLFVRWLESAGGVDAVAKLYGLRAPTVADVAAALGLKRKRVDSAFRGWAADLAEGAQDEVAFRSAKADAEALTSRERHDEAVEMLNRALQIKPGDVRTVYDLGLAQMRAERYDEAEATLDRLIALASDRQDSGYQSFGFYQKGRLLDRQGRRDEALAAFGKVLELPDVNGIHGKVRTLLEEPAGGDGDHERR